MKIESRQNPRIKYLISLRDKNQRKAEQVTLVEGSDELAIALKAGAHLVALYYSPELTKSRHELLQTVQKQGVETIELGRLAFEKAAYRESPDGWLGVVRTVDTSLDHIGLRSNPLLIVCEAVEKPGNLGAILRTASAAGADAVIAVDSRTDWSNPNIVRASKGTLFSVPVADTSSAELLPWLHSKKTKIVAATPAADTSLYDVNLRQGTALFIGTEHDGLSDFWLEKADLKVRIPMVSQLDSLNASVSAAILLYEATRQRLS